MESRRRNSGNDIIEIFKREKGLCAPRNCARRISGSENLIRHIDICGQINCQQGSIDSLAFNSTGDLIITASSPNNDVMLWEWETNKLLSSFPSGHFVTLLQAKSMPFTDDRKIITSAINGQVRLIEWFDNGASQNKILSQHQGIVNSLNPEPGNSYNFYSCGQDGFVKHYDLRNCSATDLFYCPSVDQPDKQVGLFSMVFDPIRPNYFAVGGEDVFARVYDLRNYRVNSLTKEGLPVSVFCARDRSPDIDNVMITSLAYSISSELLVSYSDHTINLFQRNMGYPSIDYFRSSAEISEYHPSDTQVYTGHWNSNKETFIGVCFYGSNDEYVVSGSENGYIVIWEKKSGLCICSFPFSMASGGKSVNQVQPHPLIPAFATSNSERNVKIWGRSPDQPAIRLDEDIDSNYDEDNDHGDYEVDIDSFSS